MCYHYSLTKKQEEIQRMVEAEWETPFEPIFHLRGHSYPAMPVLTMEKPNSVQEYYWGLVPHWVKSVADGKELRESTLNAKEETIFTKPSFKDCIYNQRCIVLADGFFEWMKYRDKKYPHYISLNGGELFGFAGVYSHWMQFRTGRVAKTSSIITTEANATMARIHNTKKRMPVILQMHQWQQWLNPRLTKEQIFSMMVSCDDSILQAHTVSRLVAKKKVNTNVPEVISPHIYPELLLEKQIALFN